MRIIGYMRVSTDEQARTGYGLSAQESALRSRAEAEAWDLYPIRDEGYSAKTLQRPGIIDAMRMLAAGEAEGIAVAKLDRISRSLPDFTRLMALSSKQGWRLVALDLGIDTATSSGRLVANLMASVAEWERERISERTSEAIMAARAQGIILGFPPVSDTLRTRIVKRREAGATFQAIADELNAEGVPTVQGGLFWRKSSVRSICMPPRDTLRTPK